MSPKPVFVVAGIAAFVSTSCANEPPQQPAPTVTVTQSAPKPTRSGKANQTNVTDEDARFFQVVIEDAYPGKGFRTMLHDRDVPPNGPVFFLNQTRRSHCSVYPGGGQLELMSLGPDEGNSVLASSDERTIYFDVFCTDPDTGKPTRVNAGTPSNMVQINVVSGG